MKMTLIGSKITFKKSEIKLVKKTLSAKSATTKRVVGVNDTDYGFQFSKFKNIV